MTPKQFLLYGGIILVALGVLGTFVLGPTPENSMLGDFFWLDSTENWAHLILGAVALGAYYMLKDAAMIRYLVLLVGVVAALAAVFGFLNAGSSTPNLGVTNLENPSDNILHLVVAVWAFWAGMMGNKESTTVS
ncbi:DUF4383 domain-containing protein [Candidatus Daviesbacteria bacterium]|nr:DUF4383 domain-containing protein [Candidatus Daviesbacteria bacterium]